MATDIDTTRTAYENYRFCYDNGHKQWLSTAKECFDFRTGQQWDPLVKQRLQNAGRPALTLDMISPMMRAILGVQQALKNDVRFIPIADASIEDAYIRDLLWMHAQQQNDFDFREAALFDKGITMGRAFLDVRCEFDDNMQGNVTIRGRRSQDVILDPSIEEYDPDTWPQVWQRRWASYNDIRAKWGEEKARAIGIAPIPQYYDYEDSFMAQQMGRQPYYYWADINPGPNARGHLVLDRQFSVLKMKELFIDLRTGDVSEIPETWDRNRIANVLSTVDGLSTVKREVKTIRWEVTCNDVVLHAADSPYKWFTTVPYFPTFIDGVTLGGVEAMLDPQRMFNKITSQELHIINTTANSGFKVKRGALQNMTVQQLEDRGSADGLVLELDDIGNVEKLLPNQTPQGHDRLSFKASDILRTVSGVSDIGRGMAADTASGKATMAAQAAQEINFASWLANLHYTKKLVAMRALDCFQSHYTEDRIFLINQGSAMSPDVKPVQINHQSEKGAVLNDVTRGKYTTALIPSPSRTSMSEEDFKLMLELRNLGIGIPDQMLIELSPANNKMQILKQLVGDSNEAAQKAAEEEAANAAAGRALQQAQTEKELAAGKLNSARADKFAVEAASDPDASYERVENARIQGEQELERQRLALQKQAQDDDYEISKEDLEIKRIAAQTRKATAEQPKARPKKGIKR
jgi:hypothetical protein